MVYSKPYRRLFKYCNLFGVFPYTINEDGLTIEFQSNGLARIWSKVTMLMIFGYICLQIGMITVSSILGKVDKIGWFSQSCWLIMAFFPLPSISLYTRRGKKFQETVSSWLQLEKDILGTKVDSQRNDTKIPGFFSGSSAPGQELEYDNFRRDKFCYQTQNHTFNKLISFYCFIAAFTATVVAIHNFLEPDFGAYISCLFDDKDPNKQIVIIISTVYEWYMVAICIFHIGSFEILLMSCVRSVRHCIETLSNLNSVSMERRTVCGRKKPKNDTLDVATIAENIEKRDATQPGSIQEMQVEDAVDSYRRVEFIVESINNTFSGSFLAHQTLYLAMMCILIFVFLRSPDTTSFLTTAFFTTIAVFFSLRICCLLPFLGKMGEDSEIFIYSWLEEIPKLLRSGKPYETAEVKLHACRVLGINCGDYYDIQGSTILTFFSIVTTYLIILLQL